MDIVEVVGDIATSVFRQHAFTEEELWELLAWDVEPEDLHPALCADRQLVSLRAEQEGRDYYALKSDLFGWFCHLNYRLARAGVFQLRSDQLALAINSLRLKGRWDSPPQGAVAFGRVLGLIGHGLKPEQYVFPLARLLAAMPAITRADAKTALTRLASMRVWEIPLQAQVEKQMRAGLAQCHDRDRAIVLRRSGLETGARMTLEEAGSPWGLTRERTRQLEYRFWSRLKAEAGTGRQQRKAFVSAMVCNFFANKGRLAVPASCGTAHLRAFLARCSLVPAAELRELGLLVLAADRHEFASLESRRYSSNQLATQAIADTLASQGPPGLVIRDVHALAQATADYRRKHLKRHRRVYLALQAVGRPAHYSRIAEIHNSMFPERAISEQSVHNCLCGEKLGVVWVGARGIYALKEWGYERPSATLFESVAEIVERTYGDTGRPVPYSVIVAEMGKTRPILNASSLTIATHCNERLRRVQGNHFVPRGDDRDAPDEPSEEELDRLLRGFQEKTASCDLGRKNLAMRSRS
jgi:hypothetical protein